jgi:hypothetical protein
MTLSHATVGDLEPITLSSENSRVNPTAGKPAQARRA